jgi:CIC family chloride channel protein
MSTLSLPPTPTATISAAIGRAATIILLGLLVGFVTSVAAISFTTAVYTLNDIMLVSEYSRFRSDTHPLTLQALSLFIPMMGGIAVAILIFRIDPRRRPSGPPDVIKAIQLQTGMPSTRSGLASTLAALISLSIGASVGQYGPMVYLGAMLGQLTARLRTSIPNLTAICISCGVAAAIAAAFNAPIAGLIFAHEVILRHYSIQTFAPVTVAATTGYFITNVIFEKTPILVVQNSSSIPHGEEFILFAVLGLLCALVALLYMQSILFAAQKGQLFKAYPIARGAAAGLVVGLCLLMIPEIIGLGQVTLRFSTLEGAFTANELALFMMGKIALTAFCLGFGFVGGVFSPALIIGALFGGLFWTILTAGFGFNLSDFSIYVVCAMMAVTSPVIGAPLSAILIVFELTRSYDLAIASMICVVFSNALAFRVFGRSLFDRQLKNQGIDLSKGRDQAQLTALRVIDLAKADTPVFAPDDTEEVVVSALKATGFNQGFLREPETGTFVGSVSRSDLDPKASTPVRNKIHAVDLIFDNTTNVLQAMERLENFVGDAVPIIDPADNRLLGVVTEADIIQAYLKMVTRLRQEENATL